MVLLIDNYDSFSYNLYQYIGVITPDIKVVRNDELSIAEIRELAPSHIVISPGPGKPSDAGVCIEAIRELYEDFPFLGICLGHQAMFEAFGGTVSYASTLMHGKASKVLIDNSSPMFSGLPDHIQAARYHSLAGVNETLPDCLQVTGWTEKDEIMAIAHKEHPLYGVQFHPESVMTPLGKRIIENFLQTLSL
jgi:anthranilate synthase component 2